MSAIGSAGSPGTVFSPPEKTPLTKVQIERISLYALAAIAAVAAAVLLAATLAGGVPILAAVLTIPLLALGSCVATYFGWTLKDFEDPIVLNKMRNEARGLTYPQLMREYGKTEAEALTVIRRYQIVTQSVLQAKLRQNCGNEPLSSFLKRCPLAHIAEYDLVPVQELRERFFAEIQALHLLELPHKFPLRDLHSHGILRLEELQQLDRLAESTFAVTQAHVHAKSLAERMCQIEERRIGGTYSERQSILLQICDDDAERARERATRRVRAVRDVGYAATDAAATAKLFEGRVGRDGRCTMDSYGALQRRLQGSAVTELATLGAGVVADEFLERDLQAIRERKREIIREKRGLDQELAYNREIQEAKKARDQQFREAEQAWKEALAPIRAAFEAFKAQVQV